MAKTSYNVNDIEVLEGLDAVRKNVGMYLGNSQGQVFLALREVVENVVDVYVKGMNQHLSIVIEDIDKKAQRYTVIDRGPGIPVEIHPKSKISTLTTVLTQLHAGSNFDKAAKGKAKSRGKHGVGVSATNAVSAEFTVWTCRKKKWYTQTFKKGKAVTKVEPCKYPTTFTKYGAVPDAGTIIQYVLDYTIVPQTQVKKEAIAWAKTVADLNKGLFVRINLNGEEQKFINKTGIVAVLDSFKESKKKITFLGKNPFVFESETVSCAIQWCDLEGETVLSYVNGAETKEGGTHVAGAFDILNKSFKAVPMRGSDFTPQDLREGMVMVLHYKCDDDDYAGQNKEKLNSQSAIATVRDAMSGPLTTWINKHKSLVKEIITRASNIKSAREEARSITRAASSIKIVNKKGSLLDNSKLAQSSKSCPPEKRELFIVEGDSAGGSASQARDPYFQEILKLRGKVLNVAKTSSPAADLANREIQNLLVALGADPKHIKKGEKMTAFRVGFIGLLVDADVDGLHIAQLLLTFFQKYAPAAIEAGIVYVFNLPLFQAVNTKNERFFGHSMEDVKKQAGGACHVSRFKGLGEMDADHLARFALDPGTRSIVRVTPLTGKEIAEYQKIVGEDTAYRKKLLGVE